MKFVFFIRIYNEWLHKGYADRGDPELVFAAAARCGTSVYMQRHARVSSTDEKFLKKSSIPYSYIIRFHMSQLLLTQVPRRGRKKDAPSTGLFNCTVARRTVQATIFVRLVGSQFLSVRCEFLEHCTIDVWSFCCSLTETMLHRYPAATGTATATAPSVLYALLFTLSYTSTTTTVTALKAPNGHPLSYIHRCPVRFTYSLTSLTFPRTANMCCVYVCMRIPQSRAIFSSQRCPPYGHILYPSEQESARDTFGNHPLSIRDTRLKKYFFLARKLIVRAERDKKSYHRFKRFARATICYSDKTPYS
uniref:Uncharacterized protein n=1 Tax=Trichogramma kaykai TaxID=54128 RepID=A0ABD2X3A8_9HYME